MLGMTVLAMAGAIGGVLLLGGNTSVGWLAVAAVAVGSIATFVPVLVNIAPDYWGVAVMFCGTARALLVVGVCYLMMQNNAEIVQRQLFLPAVGAAVFLLAVETAVAIRILARADRLREAQKQQAAAALNTH